MIDAYEIGIRLALDNGVSEGLATIRHDLNVLDAAIAHSAAGLIALKQLAGGMPVPATTHVAVPAAQPSVPRAAIASKELPTAASDPGTQQLPVAAATAVQTEVPQRQLREASTPLTAPASLSPRAEQTSPVLPREPKAGRSAELPTLAPARDFAPVRDEVRQSPPPRERPALAPLETPGGPARPVASAPIIAANTAAPRPAATPPFAAPHLDRPAAVPAPVRTPPLPVVPLTTAPLVATPPPRPNHSDAEEKRAHSPARRAPSPSSAPTPSASAAQAIIIPAPDVEQRPSSAPARSPRRRVSAPTETTHPFENAVPTAIQAPPRRQLISPAGTSFSMAVISGDGWQRK